MNRNSFRNTCSFHDLKKSDIVQDELFPAFVQYVKTHVELSKMNANNAEIPWSRQAAYDVYSAQRDPATHMFESMFGKANGQMPLSKNFSLISVDKKKYDIRMQNTVDNVECTVM